MRPNESFEQEVKEIVNQFILAHIWFKFVRVRVRVCVCVCVCVNNVNLIFLWKKIRTNLFCWLLKIGRKQLLQVSCQKFFVAWFQFLSWYLENYLKNTCCGLLKCMFVCMYSHYSCKFLGTFINENKGVTQLLRGRQRVKNIDV